MQTSEYSLTTLRTLETTFYLPEGVYPILSKYFLLFWSPEYVKKNILNGSITHGDCKHGYISYKVRFIPPADDQNILYFPQVMLSFREVSYKENGTNELKRDAYVLIKIPSSYLINIRETEAQRLSKADKENLS